MNIELFNEWIYKAEQDYRTAAREARSKRALSPDVICYHCQQCIEKYLKAYLILNDFIPPRTHDLHQLKNLCIYYRDDFKLIS